MVLFSNLTIAFLWYRFMMNYKFETWISNIGNRYGTLIWKPLNHFIYGKLSNNLAPNFLNKTFQQNLICMIRYSCLAYQRLEFLEGGTVAISEWRGLIITIFIFKWIIIDRFYHAFFVESRCYQEISIWFKQNVKHEMFLHNPAHSTQHLFMSLAINFLISCIIAGSRSYPAISNQGSDHLLQM